MRIVSEQKCITLPCELAAKEEEAYNRTKTRHCFVLSCDVSNTWVGQASRLHRTAGRQQVFLERHTDL